MASTYTFSLRLPEDIRNKVQHIAVDERRSLNKEIEHILEQYIQAYEKEHGPIEL